jgi:hypothetical protein
MSWNAYFYIFLVVVVVVVPVSVSVEVSRRLLVDAIPSALLGD